MIANLTIVAALVSSLALTGCNKPQAPRSYSFSSEDECEDAGMSDAFCDEMFPEFEDFIGKSKKPKPAKQPATPPVVKPVYRPVTPPKANKPSTASRIKSAVSKPFSSSSSRSSNSARR